MIFLEANAILTLTVMMIALVNSAPENFISLMEIVMHAILINASIVKMMELKLAALVVLQAILFKARLANARHAPLNAHLVSP